MSSSRWDVVVVGSGPAGCAAAVGALAQDPSLKVLLLDRAEFPRDKCCGDAVFGSAVTELAEHGVDVATLMDGYAPIRSLRLDSPRVSVHSEAMSQTMTVVPRRVFDARLLDAARAAGAEWRRHTVRRVQDCGTHVAVDDVAEARTLIAADGAESVLRRHLAPGMRRATAVAIRGYDRSVGDPVPRLVLEDRPGLAYAWRFPISDGSSNVGYGHLLRDGETPTRQSLLRTMHELLPGIDVPAASLRAHRLPLSTSRHAISGGRVMLVGDAASLVNPISGEGIYYAISSGLAAGRAAAAHADPAGAYRRTMQARYGRHHRHTAAMSALSRPRRVVDAALRAAASSQRVFDDIAALGLAEGVVTAGLAAALLRHLPTPRVAS